MGYIPKPPISTKPSPQSINYVDYMSQSLDTLDYIDYISQNLDTSLVYSEYVSENLDNSKDYIDFLSNLVGIQLKNPVKGMVVVPSKETIIESNSSILTQNEQINLNLGWWCQKNKTSNDFWKYKL